MVVPVNLIQEVYASLCDKELPVHLAVAWDHHGRSAWKACEDARELLRLLTYVDRKAAVLAACACARTALKYLPPGEDRPFKAIQTAEAWTRGEATEDQCREAAYTADAAAAYTADAAAAYAAWAAYAAAAAAAAAAADAAAAYAAHAAHAAGNWRQVHNQTLRELADVVRSIAQCPTASRIVGSHSTDEARQ